MTIKNKALKQSLRKCHICHTKYIPESLKKINNCYFCLNHLKQREEFDWSLVFQSYGDLNLDIIEQLILFLKKCYLSHELISYYHQGFHINPFDDNIQSSLRVFSRPEVKDELLSLIETEFQLTLEKIGKERSALEKIIH